jgi:vitamin B12 transporter
MKNVLTYLLLLCCAYVSAQTATDTLRSYNLPSAHISASVTKVRYIQSMVSHRNLNDVLRENSGIYLKSYGNGQLSSLSFRGTGAAQNDLLWNGIKLNSPSLGQVDVSLFNAMLSDELRISSISEAGNVGASVNLINQDVVKGTVTAKGSVAYGSFNTINVAGMVSAGNGRVMGTTRASYFHSNNDYEFVNLYKVGQPEQKQTNGKVSMLHFMQQFAARINANHSLFFNVWLSDAQRQIPPIMSKPTGGESQDDYSARVMLTWKGKLKGVKADFTSAYLYDVLRYRNPEINLDDKSIMQAVRNNFVIETDTFKKVWLNVNVGYEYEQAKVPAYVEVRRRHIGKLVATVNYMPVKDWTLILRLKQQVFDKTLSPFSPSLAVSYNKVLSKNTLHFHLNASRNFRFPTLNDLYWIPGGNRNLKTEKSWDGELQAAYLYQSNSYFSFKVNGFAKYITDYIQWQPNGTYWEPLNVKRVLSRGIELYAAEAYSFRGFTIHLIGTYTYTRATNLDAITPFDQSKGKQLIYVPLHLLKAHVRLEYKRFYLRPVVTYTHEVFITTDNSQALKGYALLDLEVGKDFVIKDDYEIGLAFRVSNVVGTDYQNVAQRPMPGRSFEGMLRFNMNK